MLRTLLERLAWRNSVPLKRLENAFPLGLDFGTATAFRMSEASVAELEGISHMASVSFQEHDLWQESFNLQERQELLDEDTAAFSGVTGILLFVVTGGLVLGVFSVLVILALG
jgi:hypothetical protein